VPELFLDRIEDLVPVIDPNLAEIFLDAFGKSNRKHAYMVAYASPDGKLPEWRSDAAEYATGPRRNLPTGCHNVPPVEVIVARVWKLQ
jgi:hypothetical protein